MCSSVVERLPSAYPGVKGGKRGRRHTRGSGSCEELAEAGWLITEARSLIVLQTTSPRRGVTMSECLLGLWESNPRHSPAALHPGGAVSCRHPTLSASVSLCLRPFHYFKKLLCGGGAGTPGLLCAEQALPARYRPGNLHLCVHCVAEDAPELGPARCRVDSPQFLCL